MRLFIRHVSFGFGAMAAITASVACDRLDPSTSTSSASSTGSGGGGDGGMGGTVGDGGKGGNAGDGGKGGNAGSGGSGGQSNCFAETCNNVDDDCDGVIDNGNPGGGNACMTGLPGACNTGQTSCSNGSLICAADVAPGSQMETCNGVDDDCNGNVDDVLDLGTACNTGLLGPCAAGKTACTNAMTTCEQNVTMSPEVPDSIDNDCNGMVDDGIALGKGVWAKGYGSDISNQYGFRIASDSMGNVAVAGKFSGTLDFGGGNLTMSGSPDIFVAKLDPNGGHVWSSAFLSAGVEGFANALTFDSAGNLFTTGYFQTSTTFGGTGLTTFGAGDIFITKHNPAGGVVWAKIIGESSEAQNAYDIATTPTGGIVVTGTISGLVNFGGGGLNGSPYDAFLAMYDSAGAHVFSKRFGDGTFQDGRGVAVNAAGEIVLAVDLQGTANFGGGVLTSAGMGDVAIAKYSPNGTHLWSKVYGSAKHEDISNMALDLNGNILLSGETSGPIDFGCGPASPPNKSGFYVQKLDPNGACVWTKAYGPVGNFGYYPPRVAVDPANNVVVAGSFVDILDVGAGPMTAVQNSFDVFVLKLSPSGAHVWSKQYGDPVVVAGDVCNGVATDPMGNVLLIGNYSATIDFGLGPMSTGDANATDVWVAKLSP